jgi:peptidylprolyl isomerase
MNKKLYKETNEAYLQAKSSEPQVKQLSDNILYEIIQSGDGSSPTINSIVIVRYKGSLINGDLFDDNTDSPCADAFRLKDLIIGWQIALIRMHVGDKWRIHIPSKHGYGAKSTAGIPKNSTLIFEIELVGIG